MRATYVIPVCEKEALDKAIARFQKKAAAYGTPFHAESGTPYAKCRCIYEIDPVTKEQVKTDEEWVEVYDLTIDSEVIRKDGYSVVARLEHLENGNFVQAFVDDLNGKWNSAEPHCDHCGTNHRRNVTFVVRGEDGSEKQVGKTCLKDYCGIDPAYYVSLRQLEDLILRDEFEKCDFDAIKATRVYPIETALALAIEIVKKQGYRKSDEAGNNRSILHDRLFRKEIPSDEALSEARKIIEVCKGLKNFEELFEESDEYREFKANWHKYNDPAIDAIKNMTEFDDDRFKSLDEYKQWRLYGLYSDIAHVYEDEDGNLHYESDARENWWKNFKFQYSTRKADYLVNSIRVLASSGYCKDTHIGYVAFAPVAYSRYMEARKADEEKVAANEALAAQSEYVGNPGERIVVDLKKMELVTSWETDWGTTFLYRMIDKNGNVLVWYSSREVDEFAKCKATVKAHEEYKGVRQTILTRCKAC